MKYFMLSLVPLQNTEEFMLIKLNRKNFGMICLKHIIMEQSFVVEQKVTQLSKKLDLSSVMLILL